MLSVGLSDCSIYYHCSERSKTRFNADKINQDYEYKLKRLTLSSGVTELFTLVLENVNANSQHDDYLKEQKILLRQIEDQDHFMSKAKKLFVKGKIDEKDFSSIKTENSIISNDLQDELSKTVTKVSNIEKQLEEVDKSFVNILAGFEELDMSDKKLRIDRIPPANIDINALFYLMVNSTLSKILTGETRVKN